MNKVEGNIKILDNDNFKLKLIEYVLSMHKEINQKAFKNDNVFELIAVTKGYFMANFEKEKVRTLFVKGLKKDN